MKKILMRCAAVIAEQSFVYKNQALIATITIGSKNNGVQYYTWESVLTVTPNALYRSLKSIPGVNSVQVEIVAEV